MADKADAQHVLVVDDDRQVRETLVEMIQTEGFRVSQAENGGEAIGMVLGDPPDLILTDLMMPEVNGWQLLRRVKETHPDIPVVLVTGYIADQGKDMLRSGDADGYLVKPVEHSRLVMMLRALLSSEGLGRAARVVAVDDDPDTLTALQDSLEARGIEVTPFQNAMDAAKSIVKDLPDALIVDIVLPGIDGLTFVGNLRKQTETAHIPVLMITAQPNRENVQRALALNVEGFIVKPFDVDGLAEKLRKVIRASPGRK